MLRGTRVGQAYVAITADGSGINEEIVDAVDDAGSDIEGKGKEHGDAYGENFSEGFISRVRAKISSGGSEWDQYWKRVDDRAGEGGGSAGESFVDRMTDKVRDLGGRLTDELSDRLASSPEQVRRGIDRAFDDDFGDRLGDRLGSRIVSSLSEAIDRQSGVLGTLLAEALAGPVSGNGGRGRSAGLGDLIGRMFGAGSRNNFLNLVGKTIGNVVGLVEKASNFASTFATNMNRAGEGAGLVARLMAGFSGGGGILLKLGASLPTLVIGLGAVLVVMSALVSVASALLGILTALVSTVASALVGALAVGAGALGAFAVAAGLATIAFTSMTEAQSRALNRAFQPLKAAATGLGQVMLREMVPAFESWSRSLQVALALAEPLARVMGGAFAQAGNILTAAFSGPGIQRLLEVLGVTLPGIVVNLSRAFGGFLNGAAGVFAALLPTVLRFTEYLARVANNFSAWANSARGQNSIKDFIDRALGSLKSLWNFLKAVGGLLVEVLFNPTGQRTGNNIFDNMASDIRKFTNYISRENRLEDWFKRAEKFASVLGKTIRGVGRILERLDNSATIDVIWNLAEALETAVRWARDAKGFIEDLELPLTDLLNPVGRLINDFKTLLGLMGQTGSWTPPANLQPGPLTDLLTQTAQNFGSNGIIGPVIDPSLPDRGGSNSTLQNLINSGNDALNNTYVSNGGYMPDPVKPPKFTQFEGGPVVDEWVNPYGAFAASLIKESGSMADQIRAAARQGRDVIEEALSEAAKSYAELGKNISTGFVSGVIDAVKSTDFNAIKDSFTSLINSASDSVGAALDAANTNAANTIQQAKATRDQMVGQAQEAVNAAATALANATNKKDADKAKEALRKAENDLALANDKGKQLMDDARRAADKMIADAQATGGNIAEAAATLAAQGVYTYENAVNLARGLAVEGATLADYAEARRWAADRLSEANVKLAEAISIRDNYASAVADSIRTFGTLLSAQAKVINGVEQALTANDIVESMSARLDKVKEFQENLRLLLAQGLSNEAYKQLVDAGVETGGTYAKALLSGGQGAISEVNSLTDQFGKIADDLGLAASSQLYQAGVDAAQGLVDGLMSLSAQLDSAAAALGEAIANSIKRSLGIASPSRRLRSMMSDVGDGAVLGLDDQHEKLRAASQRFSDQIAVSPEVASYAAAAQVVRDSAEGDGVSGNQPDPRFRDLIVQTPTEDPYAVGLEVLNEVVGRL